MEPATGPETADSKSLMTLEEAERILTADWRGYHWALCGENLGDGPCECAVGMLLRAAKTVKVFLSPKGTT